MTCSCGEGWTTSGLAFVGGTVTPLKETSLAEPA